MTRSVQVLASDESISPHRLQSPFSKEQVKWSFLACPKREMLTPIRGLHSPQLALTSNQAGTAYETLEELWGMHVNHPSADGWSLLNKRNSRWLDIQDGTTQETLCGAGPWNHSRVDLMPPSLKQGDAHPDHGVQAAISSSYQNGELSKVHELVQHSKQEVCIDNHVLFHMLQTCIDRKDVAAGKRAYYLTVESGLESDALLGSQLIRMFESFEKLSEAKQVFSKLLAPDTLSWSAIISAHCKLGQREQAMSLYFEMTNLRIQPDGYVFVAILKACTTMAHGKLIHAHVIESGLESHVFVCNTLIAMYIRCGNLDNAIVVFSRLPERDVVTWSALISGYTQYDFGEEALELFQQMQMDGMVPNPFTFSCILKACSSIADIEHGVQIHSCIIENGFEFDIFIANTLIDMYCKCHSLDIACNVFERLPNRDVATWNAMITGYGQVGHGQEALQLLQQMQRDGIQPDKVTFICSLKACSSSAALEQGEEIHAHLIACGFESDIVVGNILIDMYGRCGSLHYALSVFHRMPERDVITWSGLITGYALHGLGQEALQLFYRMGSNGLEPNWVTFICLLKACASTEDFGQDNHVHALIVKAGFGENVFVGSGLIDLYGKHGNLHSARMVFDRLPRRDVGTWNSMISVYTQQGLVQTAIQLFWQMQQEDMEPDQITIVSILKACSSIVAFEQGLQVHCFICGTGLESDLFVGNTLIDMYSKCGSLDDANIMFGRLPKRDVITWNAMIAGFAQNCNYILAAQCFRDMQKGGLKPDEVTFLCLLSACGHVGLVSEGCIHFKSMIEDHGIMPMLEHFNSMIDILGHASLFSEAEDLLESIPFQFNLAGWTSLLCSCRTHCNVNLGKQCFDQVMRIDPGFAPGYVLMSNMYAHAGMWEDVERIQNLKRFVNTWKKPAKAFIEINKQVHQFTVGDKTHPRSNMIYAKLKALNMQLKEEGYVPQQQQLFVHLLPDEDKEDALCGHCERLAIAFGLVSTSQGTTIRIAKNLRVCADCHNATKMISKVERREIILIDAYCVHHFKEGGCSCTDFS